MKRRITILCENSVGAISGTLGEHGFAALIESEAEAVLFDCGQGATLLHNARRLNRPLSLIQRVVLSHGHYDHTGGLLPLLTECGGKVVAAHPGIFTDRYRVKDTGERISIGMPYKKEELERKGCVFDLSAEFREIGADIFVTGYIPRLTSFEHGDSGLYCDEAGCEPDHILDDQSLVICCDKGIVLLLGCCHAGIINTLEHVTRTLGRNDIYAVVGGTHLGFCSSLQLDETVKRLHGYRIKKICGSHCTGFAAAARLSREFPGHFHPAQVGFTLEI
ncbi:MBL fold metallo-hydrolase [Geobacter sp. DSM 9736]|uniref:MBL fold metallo-hydrolase n=1 Tax=Geobacter sp. DSM 9736 TaxID=1277350 RepID=UPI000B4FDA44|nr:MBL fold metallo-hydrolase [Geobacter sp. DSM 9736]SNB47076.1 7,8-dihydropterin-6-yl-methyl-4-(beta-D-ribofuranosyl)aminobenzene 5'-phosphate synthase [Geobacter sp. DSM 9736]